MSVREKAPLGATASLQGKSRAQTLLVISALSDWLVACLQDDGPKRTSVRTEAPLRATTNLQGKSHAQALLLISALSDWLVACLQE